MTSRALNFAFLAAIAAAVPMSAGIFSDGEPKATKGTLGEKVSFIEGTSKGIAPHTVGTLVMRENKQMVFRYAKGSVAIPYQSITNAEIGPTRGRDAGPSYKVWNAPKRFGNKTRYLTILYTENGTTNKLVFELADKAATLTVAQIEIAQGKRQGTVQSTADNDELWWGDKFWRTNRNADKWNKTAGTEAPKSSAPDR